MADGLARTLPAAAPAQRGSTGDSLLPLVLDRICYSPDGKTVLNDINLELSHGLRTVILGPNGAGKSLLLRLCHGLLKPTSGRISWAGKSAALAAARQGMVFQRPVLLRRKVADNIAHVLAAKGVRRKDRDALVLTSLENAGLAHLADRPARTLSGGEQQRLTIARACVCDPDVLLLDEPSASLDPAAARAVEELIVRIHASGTRIIMTTHDIAQARRLAEEVIFLHHGRLLEHSPAEAFFTAPRDPAAARFIRGELID
ncbi:MAG: ATP-binding cassette domain-containing protein [Gammaproteobacteria bacterium]|nr:MAG: ATP-binding cassette domain-containing protein [Gammaproteobacteria bacterium]